MTLITGGAYSGKTEFAIKKFNIKSTDIIDGAECSLEQVFACRAIRNFQLLVKRFGTNDGAALTRTIHMENPDLIIITNEIGSGIIPMEKSDRIWREETGRAGCAAAGFSDLVVRMCCGIPTAIKGELP